MARTTPSDPNQVQLWTQAQAQSQAFANSTDEAYLNSLRQGPGPNPPLLYYFPLGKGSIGISTFFTNGRPPNAGNTNES